MGSPVVLAVCQLIAVAIYAAVVYFFGMWWGLGIVAALVAFNVYWKLTRGEWFE